MHFGQIPQSPKQISSLQQQQQNGSSFSGNSFGGSIVNLSNNVSSMPGGGLSFAGIGSVDGGAKDTQIVGGIDNKLEVGISFPSNLGGPLSSNLGINASTINNNNNGLSIVRNLTINTSSILTTTAAAVSRDRSSDGYQSSPLHNHALGSALTVSALVPPSPSLSNLHGIVKTISYAFLQAPSQLLLTQPNEDLHPDLFADLEAAAAAGGNFEEINNLKDQSLVNRDNDGSNDVDDNDDARQNDNVDDHLSDLEVVMNANDVTPGSGEQHERDGCDNGTSLSNPGLHLQLPGTILIGPCPAIVLCLYCIYQVLLFLY